MKKCPKPLGYGIRRTPVVLGLSAALCMPAAFSYANVDNGMDRESVLSVMQGKTIKGQILDETGESMIGVSVLVKGTTIGTVTDFDGNYTLEVPSGKNILEISYIGYKTKEITIGNNSLINIKMEPDTQALDEVVAGRLVKMFLFCCVALVLFMVVMNRYSLLMVFLGVIAR